MAGEIAIIEVVDIKTSPEKREELRRRLLPCPGQPKRSRVAPAASCISRSPIQASFAWNLTGRRRVIFIATSGRMLTRNFSC